MIKIEKGIPLPEKQNARNYSGSREKPRPRYPWKDMNIGDSFLAYSGHTQPALSSLAWRGGKTYGMKFTTCQEGDRVRVWRLS